ncbi:MAG: hypothetical protein V7L14_12090 [Nostoc sp.]
MQQAFDIRESSSEEAHRVNNALLQEAMRSPAQIVGQQGELT